MKGFFIRDYALCPSKCIGVISARLRLIWSPLPVADATRFLSLVSLSGHYCTFSKGFM